MSNVDVIELGAEEVVWRFSKEPPRLQSRGTRVLRSWEVDPTPAYGHAATLVREMLDQVAACFPLPWPISIYLLPHEELGRSNAATSVDFDYDGPKDEQGRCIGRVVTIHFSAKRIPIHPAMTRYLVAHEYGHAVEEYLNERAGHQLFDNTLIREYAALRGLERPPHYGCGVWHRTPGEIFANDFRVLVTGLEPEYWPHPGIERPETSYAIRGWWDAQCAAIRGAQAA